MAVLAIVGPTAVGKSAAAISIAHTLGGSQAWEIIGADAMQLYRGMDIGTAKVTLDERAGIPHHQIDVLDISEDASVAAYQRHAREDLDGIVSRGRMPLLVGGSGLYISAVLDRIDFPGFDLEVRARLEQECERDGAEAMHARLRRIDPRSADVIDPRNVRRVIRALEVNEVSGHSFQPVFPRHTSHYPDTVVVGLEMSMEELHARIEARTRLMMSGGLLEETQALRERGLDDAPTARMATGYREALAVLNGTMTTSEAEAAISAATRRLVKKQYTWFRRDPRIQWIPAGDGVEERLGELVSRIVE